MTSEFKRENRYIVIKRKDLDLIGPEEAESIETTLEHIQDIFRSADSPDREYLVIESDWPEYEPVWAVIEARMTGPAPQPPALGGEPEVYGWVWTEELKGVEVNDGISFGPNKPKFFSHIGTTFQYAPLYTQHVVVPLLAEIGRVTAYGNKRDDFVKELQEALQIVIAERDTLRTSIAEDKVVLAALTQQVTDYQKLAHERKQEIDTLKAEIARSNSAHEAAAQHQGALNTEIYTLKARCDEALCLLRFCEWHYEEYDETYHRESGYRCPECGSYKADGHNDGCDIGNFIAKEAAPTAKPECAFPGYPPVPEDRKLPAAKSECAFHDDRADECEIYSGTAPCEAAVKDGA